MLTELDWARMNNALGRIRARLDDERFTAVQPDLSAVLDFMEKVFEGGDRCMNPDHRAIVLAAHTAHYRG